MTFGVTDGWNLLVSIIFVFWRPSTVSRKQAQFYSEHSKRLPWILRPPAWIFPLVWFALDCLVAASFFLYFKFVQEQSPGTADGRVWALYGLFIVNILASKLWTPLFFGMRMFGLALANSVFLVLTAVAVFALMICSWTFAPALMASDVWFIPFTLYIFYVAWLMYATAIQMGWSRKFVVSADGLLKLRIEMFPEEEHHHHHRDHNHKKHDSGRIHHKPTSTWQYSESVDKKI